MTPLETELQHLLNLAAPPYRDQWLEYVKWKAEYLEKKYPQDYPNLKALLTKAMHGSSESSGSGR